MWILCPKCEKVFRIVINSEKFPLEDGDKYTCSNCVSVITVDITTNFTEKEI